MLSNLFIDRPRLAVVIAIVITLAGVLAMLRIPVAQFPDIVPPQVPVTALYPGASAAVVESTVAQPIEAQVNGVDKMIYMKSTSGNDGSYTLTVTFALGTNPDIDTVNVNNRVRPPCRSCRRRCSAAGPDGQQAVLGAAAVHRAVLARPAATTAVPHQLRHHQRARRAGARCPASARRTLFGTLELLACASGSRPTRLTSLNLTPTDVVTAIQAQNIQAPVGRIGAQPIADDQQFQLNSRPRAG